MASISVSERVKILRDTLVREPSDTLEKLAAALVNKATGLTVRVASSGAQVGGDAGTQKPHSPIRLEAKRYGETSALRERELLGEITQAVRRDRDLDLWILVTTSEASEQLATALIDYGAEQGVPILILDWSGVLPQLAKLCAACPDLVESLVSTAARAAAKDLASEDGVSTALQEFRAELGEWSAGWAMTADMCRHSMHQILTDPSESRAFFRQDIAVGVQDTRLVERSAVSSALDDWRRSAISASPLFVLGEEGRGKSWAMAAWLNALVEPSATILYCSAAEFRSLDHDTIEEALAHALSIRSGVQTQRYWRKRIERLMRASEPSEPIIWLIIDGLNESSSVDWLGILLHAQRDVWRTRVRLGSTCRSRYFQSELGGGVALTNSPTVVSVPRFSEAERDAALRLFDVDPSQLSPDVLELAMVPRICRLVVRLVAQLEGAERVTYERLLFEYGKRFDPDARSGLTTDAWLAFLRELAAAIQGGLSTIKRSELRKWIDVGELQAVEAALNDIVDGLLVRQVDGSPGVYEFDKALVLAANGMALWKLLDTAEESSEGAVADLLSQQLEPLDGLDDRAKIIRAALAAAILSGSTTGPQDTIIVALLNEGLSSQNVSDDDCHSILSHTETAPKAYVRAVATLARSDKHDEAAAVSAKLRSKVHIPAVRGAMLDAATDWIRLVAIGTTGIGSHHDSDRRREAQIIRWLGEVPLPGEKEVSGVPLVFESGHQGHALPLYALQFVQTTRLAESREFWRRFAFANVLSDDHNVSDSASWVVRLNRFDYPATQTMLSNLAIDIASGSAPVDAQDCLPRRAAAKLLWLNGDEASDEKAREFVPEPDNWAVFEKERNHPEDGVFQLQRSQVEIVLERSRQPVQRLFERARDWWADSCLEIPDTFRARSLEYLDAFDLSDVATGFSTSRGDHSLEAALPGFSRCVDIALARFIARLMAALPHRTGTEWASLAIDLAEFWLAVSADDRAIALRALERHDIDGVDDDQLGRARAALRGIAFTPHDNLGYVRALIQDQVQTMSAQSANAFGVLSDGELQHLLAEVRSIDEPYADWVFINLLANTETTISVDAAEYLLSCTRSALSGIRLHALFVLAGAGCASVAAEFAATNWSWRDVESDAERRHGSDVLLTAEPPLPIAEVVRRVAPWRIPKAAYLRNSAEEVALLARTVSGFLQVHDVPPRHPFEEVTDLASARFTDPLGKFSLQEPEDLDWLDRGLQKAFDIEARLDELWRAEREALRSIAAHRESGRSLYGEWVRPEHIEALLEAAPNEMDSWLQGLDDYTQSLTLKIRSAAGFYLSLCSLLLSKDPNVGIKLWRAIDNTPHITKFVGAAGINLRLLIAFEAAEADETRALWDELWDISCTSTNLDLFQVVLAAERGGRQGWLDESIQRDLRSTRPWRRTRAIFASSFKISPDLDRAALSSPPGLYNSLEHAEQQAARIAARAVWQYHWLRQFASAQSDLEAFASFTVFLTQADRRWTLIIDKLRRDGIAIGETRMKFLRMRQADIERKSKKVDDGLRKVFLGRRTVTAVWPWLRER